MALIGEWGFNEGTGTTAADTSGLGHTMTASSGSTAWTTPGHAGSTAAAVASWSAVAGTVSDSNYMSMMFWLKVNTAPTQYGEIVSCESLSIQVWSDLTVYCDVKLPPSQSPTAYSMRTTDTVPLGQWVHVTFSCDATTGQGIIYLNGVASLTQNGFPGDATVSFEQVDLLKGDYQPALNCTLDDVRLFDTIVATADVPTWMNTYLGAHPVSSTDTLGLSDSSNVVKTTGGTNWTQAPTDSAGSTDPVKVAIDPSGLIVHRATVRIGG